MLGIGKKLCLLTSCSLQMSRYPSKFLYNNFDFCKSFIATMQMIKTEKVGKNKNIGLITLNRPKTFNSLCAQLIQELSDALNSFDSDKSVGVIIITGSNRAFSVGADIKEIHSVQHNMISSENWLQNWTTISRIKKPIIAAVNGHALGGGCELAMMCDIIYAGENAMFGQPEVTIGTIPGAGGTQRWLRVAGKSVAMEICLTGNSIPAQEAKECGIVAKIFPVDAVVSEAIKTAEKISSHSSLIVSLVKDAINRSYETFLQEGLQYESRLFHASLSTDDCKEGVVAFLKKRKPKWSS